MRRGANEALARLAAMRARPLARCCHCGRGSYYGVAERLHQLPGARAHVLISSKGTQLQPACLERLGVQFGLARAHFLRSSYARARVLDGFDDKQIIVVVVVVVTVAKAEAKAGAQ